MRISYRVKLLVSHAAIAVVATASAALATEWALAGELEARIDRRLEGQAHAVARWLERARHVDQLAPRLAAVVGAEVTVIDADGVALGGSHDPYARYPYILPGGLSPEIREAQAGRTGRATRHESAREREMRYVAVPGPRDLTVRLGVPTEEIDATREALRPRVAVAAVTAFALAALLGGFIARALSRRLRIISAAAERLGRGDYQVPAPEDTGDEIGVLSTTLHATARQLEAQERHRREFLANVAHELRTPVASIQGYAETLNRREVDSETRAEFLGSIHRNAVRIARLVDELLELEALEQGGAGEPAAEPVPVGPIVIDAIATVRATAAGEPTFSTDVPEELQVLASEHALHGILGNLIDNAVKHGGPGVGVRIEARRRDRSVSIAVTDDGGGIAADHLPRLFDRFYRVDPGNRAGSGLGLAIVRRLVEAHGGTIRCESVEGEGTTFTVELPAA